MATVRFTTDLSTSECLERLGEFAGRTKARGWFERFSDPTPLLVWVRGDRFKILKIDGPHRNDFRRLFDGKVNDLPSGALIEGRFRLRRPVAAIVTISFGVLCAMGSLTLFSLWRFGPHQNQIWMMLTEAGMALVLVVISRVGIRTARRGEEEVLQFVRNTLQARFAG
jgi:hypothetical protein